MHLIHNCRKYIRIVRKDRHSNFEFQPYRWVGLEMNLE